MTSTDSDKTLGHPAEFSLSTRSGMAVRLRPVEPSDEAIVAELFERLSPEDLRFRFLDSRKLRDSGQIHALIDVDHRQNEHLLAFEEESGELAASLMILADEPMETAEVAIAVAESFKGRGIGYALLKHAADVARERGIRRLCSIESRANHDALEVERALGFRSRAVDGEPGLVVVEVDLFNGDET